MWKFGDPLPGTKCPWCGFGIVYNGNYYCSRYEEGLCGWRMTHDPVPRNEKHLFNVAYVTLMRLTDREPDPKDLELKKDGTPW